MQDETLRKCGLTCEQVRRLTADMRLPVTDLRPDVDGGDAIEDWILAMISRWRSFPQHTLAAMCRMEPIRFHRVVQGMVDKGLPIAMEKLNDTVGTATFICQPELVTTKQNEH